MKNMTCEALKTALLATLAMVMLLSGYRALFRITGNMVPVTETDGDGMAGEVFSQLGDIGDEVLRVQERLREKGYLDGGIDGIYDEETALAVRLFQEENGLTPNGIAGPKTLLLLGVAEQTDAAAFNRTELLARIVWAQAGDYGYLVQLAAAKTILNRLESDAFADTLTSCAFEGRIWSEEERRRFSEEPPAASRRAASDAENDLSPVTDALFWYDSGSCTDEFLLSREIVAVLDSVCFVK